MELCWELELLLLCAGDTPLRRLLPPLLSPRPLSPFLGVVGPGLLFLRDNLPASPLSAVNWPSPHFRALGSAVEGVTWPELPGLVFWGAT